MKRAASLLLLLLATNASAAIRWESWDDNLFARAKKENRFVLLDLEAVWCHWCHVMDEMTYADEDVIKLIGDRYIAVRVDQDSRPDLSNKYEDYGWPATIVFNADGGEIVRRRGYIPPGEMTSMLQAIIDDPSPGPSVFPDPVPTIASDAQLSDALRRKIRSLHEEHYDAEHGSWGFMHKYLDAGSIEYAIERALDGEEQSAKMAKQTLTAELALVDPAWGGVYQYSTGGDWKEPHFEKIMSMQATNLRAYAFGYAAWRDASYLRAAESIHHFATTFLRAPDGAFYTSQDADLVQGEHSAEYFALDDAARRKLGIPRVDQNIYPRENGWMIEAICALYDATGKPSYLDDALRAARHEFPDRGYFGDAVALGRAYFALYTSTGDAKWLVLSEKMAQRAANFRDAAGGYLTTRPGRGKLAPSRQRDENVAFARLANLLFHVTSKPAYREMSAHAMRWLAAPEVASLRPTGAVLLADYELTRDPLHLTIIGKRSDPVAAELYRAALAWPAPYKRVEWLEVAKDPYPKLDRAAAFSCSGNACSLPAFSAEQLRKRLRR